MFEYSHLYIIIEPLPNGEFNITATDQEPKTDAHCQFWKRVARDFGIPEVRVYGIDLHIGEVNFEQMDLEYWRFYQILQRRREW